MCALVAATRVFTRGELIDACLADVDALERTVDSHISRLRKKLEGAGASGTPEVMRGIGYRLRSRQ
ncbi:transcriptional regulator [Burkholderia sp. MSh2]|nr:transcriptional regulator [Burkholderia sp. MSh2]